MNIPIWLGERLAGAAVVEPPDGAARALGEMREVTPTASGLHLAATVGACTARFLSDAIVELRYVAPGDVDLPSFARLEVPQHAAPTAIAAGESDGGWFVRSPRIDLRLEPGLGASATTAGGAPIFASDTGLPVGLTPRGWRAHWQLEPGDRVYGLGAKTGRLDRRGRRTVLWARDALVGDTSDPLYSAIPFFLIARGSRWIGVLLDSAARCVFDIGHTVPDRLAFGPCNGALVYVVFTGPSLADVLGQYTSLTGRMPLPPRWSLGHHQSRYSYNDADEVREIAAEFRRRDIPTDAIHLDIHYMRGFRVFTFDPKRFPRPPKLADDLAADGFRLVAIVDPGVKKDKRWDVYKEGVERGYFTRSRSGAPFIMKVWPGDSLFPDFFRAEVRQWWGGLHHAYTDAGIAGIWNDMNEPAGWNRAWYVGDGVIPFGEKDPRGTTHRLDDGRDVAHEAVRNAYGHTECRATYEGLSALRPGERPFVLTRSAFAGTQRWAAQWTGDVMSTWSALRQSLPMMMGLGLSGQAFVGSDIGGFFSDSNPELYARWVQIGALSPFCRSHTSLYTHRQEPWSFGPKVESIARAALKQRYQLLPYLYTCLWQTSQTGLPLWRPLLAEFPGEGLEEVEDQVMIGPSMMAAPVLEQGAVSRRVVLPSGVWFDWYNGHRLEGGTTITVDAPLERMPLFVRGSAAIPTQPEVRFADDRPEHPLLWEVFLAAGATGEIGRVYEDDGHSFAYRDGACRLTTVRVDEGALHFGPGQGRYVSPRARALIHLYGAEAVDALEIAHGSGESVVRLK